MMLPETNNKFIAISCEDGLYIKRESRYTNTEALSTAQRINEGKHEIVSTWNKEWILLKGATEITSYQIHVSGKKANYRWELIDKDDNPLQLPEVMSVEDAHEIEDDFEWRIGNECKYYKYHSLYYRASDRLPSTWENVEFEVEYRGELSVKDVNNFQDMKVTLHKDKQYGYKYGYNEDHEVDLSSIVNYYELDEMLVAPLAIHNRPCKLTSPQTYKIIRGYVKQHIDYKYAEITSDYDFCFTVKKRIHIKPYIDRREIKKSNGRSYARPKFSNKEVDHKLFTIYEMTDSNHRYKGYSVIKGFEGDNLQDIATQIKVFLDELMDRINEPLSECDHCKGYGYIVNKEKITH